MTETESEDLRKEILELASAVSGNTEALRKSKEDQARTEKLAKRANLNSIIAVAAALLSLALGGVCVFLYNEIQANAVTSCENANNSRAVQRILWNGILDAPRDPDEPPLTEQEIKFREAFRDYVNTAFGDRDCTNLDKKYPEPVFPELGDS